MKLLARIGSATGGSAVTSKTFEAKFSGEKDGRRVATLDMGLSGRLVVTVTCRQAEGGIVFMDSAATVEGGGAGPERLEHLSIELPLALAQRKRVVQAGEGGLVWDTRAAYQFHAEEGSHTLLPEPDTNIWSIFRSDWTAGDTYTLARWESVNTAPFVLHRGSGFPGWMAVYDRTGGVVVAMDEPVYRRPVALEVRTDGGGEAGFDLQPASADPIALVKDGKPLDLHARWKVLAFIGAFADQGGRLAREVPVVKAAVAQPVEPARELPVFGGVPLQQGWMHAGEAVALSDASGRPVAVQAKPLAYWPDGSIKWLNLVFFRDATPAAPAKETVKDEPSLADFQVTYGTGKRERFVLRKADASGTAAGLGAGLLSADCVGDEVRVRTGRLEAVFAPGRNWWRSLSIDGRPALSDAAAVYLDVIKTDAAPEPGALTPGQGAWVRSLLVADHVVVEEDGPIRVVVRVDGHTGGPAPCRVTLRLEFYAGSPAIRGYDTLELGDFDVRHVFISGFGLELPLKMVRQGAQALVSTTDGRRVETAANEGVALRALHPDVCELRAGASGDSREVEVGGDMEGFMAVNDGQGQGMVAGIRDLRHLFPSEVALRPSEGRLTLDLAFWPRSGGLMDFRRYSDYPHRAQGETITTDKSDWVEAVYYQKQPVCGISSTHEFFLAPVVAGQASVAAFAAALDDRPLIYSGETNYLKTGALANDLSDPGFSAVNETLGRFADFLEFHQARYRWYGQWFYGDIQHRFGNGYGRIVSAGALADMLEKKTDDIPPGVTVRDYFPANDWASDNGRWGWSNTEGLPARYLGQLYLRTGRRDVFFELEAMARHSRDVVIRHSGLWYGNGTRHGVQPWSDGDHEQRQTIPSEYRLDFFLTGDPRSRDVLLDYGYNVYLKPVSELLKPGGVIQYHADHSARLYGLVTLWEATGDPKVAAALRKYVDQFIVPEGIAISPSVRFPEIERAAAPEGINSGNMFFNSFGGMQALVDYYNLTRYEPLRIAICRMAASALDDPAARKALDSGEINSKYFYWPALAFAARHADDPEPYRSFLQNWMAGAGWLRVHELVTGNRAHWTGSTAFMPDNMAETLFWLNTLPSVAGAAGPPAPLTPPQREQLQELEANGRPHPRREGSWQDQYDQPVFYDYLGRWLPWNSRQPATAQP